jgi:LasA protease
METLSKPSSVPIRKIRSNAKRFFSILFILILSIQAVSCTRIVIYPSEETATALAKGISQSPTQTAAAELPVSLENASIPTSSPAYEAAQATPTAPILLATALPTQANTASSIPSSTLKPTVSTPLPAVTEDPPILYYTQAGDTLEAISIRFHVEADQISSPDLDVIPAQLFLQPNLLLVIPDQPGETSLNKRLMPDSEIIYSPSAIGFDAEVYVNDADGYLADFREWRTDGWYNGGQVIQRVAYENSVNPRLLLAVVEYQSHWISNDLTPETDTEYPLGWQEFQYKDLYKQLTWAIMEANIGYYGWRTGRVTELSFPDGTTLQLAPDLNAGTVAVMYLFSKLYNPPDWQDVMYGENSFISLYNSMFGDAWRRAQAVEPFFPTDLEQPELVLPFEPGKTWTLTSGPHAVWGPEGVLGALDFAPPSIESNCVPSNEWVTASASGIVTRSYNGAVVVDLDGDGFEQTGWSLFYMHIHHDGRVQVGDWVNVGDHIGHPSCEGGRSTGTHMHFARKYNGEWIPADGPLAFDLEGWIAHNGDIPYHGTMTRGDQTVISDVNSSYIAKISRSKVP